MLACALFVVAVLVALLGCTPQPERTFDPQQVVVVGHSNTLPAMIEALTHTLADDLARDAYDDLFVATITEHPDQRTPDDVTVERQRFGAGGAETPED